MLSSFRRSLLAAAPSLVLLALPVRAADFDAQSAAGEALAGEAPPPPLRSGSLGLPTPAASSVLALLNNQVALQDNPFGTDLFARVGKLALSSSASVEALGETFAIEMPTASVAVAGSPVTQPAAVLQPEPFGAVGLRFTFAGNAPDASSDRAVSRCLTLRANNTVLAPGDAARCSELGVDMAVASSNENDVAAWVESYDARSKGFRVDVGMRFLYQGASPSGSDQSTGYALEMAPQLILDHWAIFASGSWLQVGRSRSVTGESSVVRLPVSELRAVVGARFRTTAQALGSQLLPTVGAYVAYTKDYWHDEYAAAGDDVRPSSDRVEATLYVSGHFSGAFSGQLGFGVVRPYGGGPTQYVVSVTPIVGAVLR